MKVNLTIGIPSWLDKIFTWPMMWYRRRKYGYDFRRIYLGEGEWTILDQQDYYRYCDFKWGVSVNETKIYAVCNIKNGPGQIRVARLHREIMEAPAGLFVDHRNGDSLDNRRDNLRLATPFDNQHNRQKTKSKTSSRFIGVSYDKSHRKWLAKIGYRGKRIFLGRFNTEEAAARAYDAAARKYHGEFARLNFPEETPVS